MAAHSMATRQFTMSDQQRFADLSGDRNPLHLDRIIARRQLPGDVVIHGIHTVLWLLDAWCDQLANEGASHLQPRTIKGRFPNPLYLDQDVTAVVSKREENNVRLQARCGDLLCCDLRLSYSIDIQATEPIVPFTATTFLANPAATPRKRTLCELTNDTGTLPLVFDVDAANTLFPGASAMLPHRFMAQLLATTRLVGMVCPGLHSMYSAFQLSCDHAETTHENQSLEYRVTETNAAYALVQIEVCGACLSGQIDAFVRPQPVIQPNAAAVRERIAADAYISQTALIVGGSRGLGEATAKIIAAGGGHAIITYASGCDDALCIAGDIRSAGGKCDVFACDIADPDALIDQLQKVQLQPTHLYYFATPKIFVARQGEYDQNLYDHFAAFYVEGLRNIIAACRAAWATPLAVFNPSSTAIDEDIKALTEYADAKRAGEQLCAECAAADEQLTIICERLPRIATDQTSTMVAYPAADAVDIMLPVVQRMGATSEESKA